MRIPVFLLLALGCTEYDLAGIDGPEGGGAGGSAAGGGGGDTAVPDEETASVKGRVCNLDGSGYVVGAVAWIALDRDGDGVEDERIEDTTDADGYFLLEGVPLGEHTIHVEKGSFSTTIEVALDEPGLLELAEEECLTAEGVSIAVVTGAYDDIGSLLRDLGLEFDVYNGQSEQSYLRSLLLEPDVLGSYDIVFINCGVSDGWISTARGEVGSNLKDYVEGGGSLYLSDWAHYFFEVAFPDAIDWYGNDNSVDAARVGQSGRLSAEVLDANMAAIVGSDTADLNYDLDAWVIPEATGSSNAEVLIRGDAPVHWYYGGDVVRDAPLAVRFTKGDGTVIYTTFHNETQMTFDMERLLEEIVLNL